MNPLNQFLNQAYLHNRLFSFELDVAEVCNADCIFCFKGEKREKKRSHLSIDQYDNLFRDAKSIGGFYIGFSGGEPFCNPQLLEILSLAKEYGYRVGLISNGQLIREKDVIKLGVLNLSKISISFHGFNEHTYASHFNVDRKYYKKVINTIKSLLLVGCNVGIAYTVTKYNIDEFLEAKDMFVSMGIAEENVKFNMLLHGDTDVSQLYPSLDQLQNVRKHDPQYFNKIDKMFSRSMICAAGRCSCGIDVYGDVYPCTFFNTPCGNITQDSIVKIWNDSHVLKIIRSFTESNFHKCVSCSIKNNCKMCLIDNINTTGNVFLPNDELCIIKHKENSIEY